MKYVYKAITILGNVALANLFMGGVLFLFGLDTLVVTHWAPAVAWILVGLLRFVVLMVEEE